MKRVIVLLLLVASGARPAQADQHVTVKASAGLGGMCRPGRWTPVRVDVGVQGQAPNDTAVAGEVEVEWGNTRVRRAVTLASPSHKLIELYIRTSDARDSMKVRVLRDGREAATTMADVRLVRPEDRLVVCVAPTSASTIDGVVCTTTVNSEVLPRSWRGYVAADDVVLPAKNRPTLTVEQQGALDRWRLVNAIQNTDSSTPFMAEAAPPSRAFRRTGTALLFYVGAFGVLVWPMTRIRRRSLAAYPLMILVVAGGSIAVLAAGRFGPGAAASVSQTTMVEQVAGLKGSLLTARGSAELPSFGDVELRAEGVDGMIAPRGRNHGELRFDENGAPVMNGTYGLGSTAAFDVEAVSAFEGLNAEWTKSGVRITNTSGRELRDCRFGAGYSKRAVGALAPGQSVDATRRDGDVEAIFSCRSDAAVIGFTEAVRPVRNEGVAAIVIHLPEPRSQP